MNLMDKLVSLAKRRGFIFPSSEIYGGLNGAWDYGPLGVELKRNIKQAWWDDMITRHDELETPAGAPSEFSMVGLDSALLMNPRVWEASGHVGGFNDPMVDDRETKVRYRADQLVVFALKVQGVSRRGNANDPHVPRPSTTFSSPHRARRERRIRPSSWRRIASRSSACCARIRAASCIRSRRSTMRCATTACARGPGRPRRRSPAR